MTDNAQASLALFAKKKRERDEKIKQARARVIEGKAPFDLEELKQYWSYRYEKGLNEAQLAEDMLQIENDYYLSGEQFMSMEAYGKYLMEMEFYR